MLRTIQEGFIAYHEAVQGVGKALGASWLADVSCRHKDEPKVLSEIAPPRYVNASHGVGYDIQQPEHFYS